MSNHLSWGVHLNQLERRLESNIGIIRQSSFFLTRKILTQLYYALIRSYLYYCISVWGGANNLHSLRLIKLQLRFFRIMANVSYTRLDNSLSEYIKEVHSYGVLSFCSLYKLSICIIMYKRLHSNYLANTIPISFPSYTYPIRDKRSLCVPFCPRNYLLQILSLIGPRL